MSTAAYFCAACGTRIAALALHCVACSPSGCSLYVDPTSIETARKAKAALPPEVPAAHGESESKPEKAEKPKKPS